MIVLILVGLNLQKQPRMKVLIIQVMMRKYPYNIREPLMSKEGGLIILLLYETLISFKMFILNLSIILRADSMTEPK